MRRFEDRGGFGGRDMRDRDRDRDRPRGREGFGALGLESAVEEVRKVNELAINREKTCPFLLRLFYQLGRHNSPMDYHQGSHPLNELQIYTWMDASLREVTGLITDVNQDTRKRGTLFEFSIVSAINGHYRLRSIGSTYAGEKNFSDTKTLAQSGFVIGDYLDISITPPHRVIGNMRRRPY